jgi:dihydropteroate synthase type 2
VKSAPQIVGIVNITLDSFSDGGQFVRPEDAIAHARQLALDGADYLELGPASSNPDAQHVPSAVQINRLTQVLGDLKDCEQSISIDATDSAVLEFAMDSEVAMLNDIRGFSDPALYPRLADSRAHLVVVHSLLGNERAERTEATSTDVLTSIDRFFDRRLTELIGAGVAEDRLIVDPGMGFFLGRNPEASIAVLQRIPELKARFGRPVFISVSRKSFLRAITGQRIEHITAATLAAELHAASEGAAFLRTHDVSALSDALKVAKAIRPD